MLNSLLIAVYLAAIFILIQWFTTSIVISDTGPVHWAEGWDRTVEKWL